MGCGADPTGGRWAVLVGASSLLWGTLIIPEAGQILLLHFWETLPTGLLQHKTPGLWEGWWVWSLQGVCFSASLFSCVFLHAKADEDTPSEPYGLSPSLQHSLRNSSASGRSLWLWAHTDWGPLLEDTAMLHGDGRLNPSESLGTGNYIQVFWLL